MRHLFWVFSLSYNDMSQLLCFCLFCFVCSLTAVNCSSGAVARPHVSLEFFVPRTEEGVMSLQRKIRSMKVR